MKAPVLSPTGAFPGTAMYRYDEFDHAFVQARIAEFSEQVERRLAGELTEDQFRPLRLMNGVYLQLHSYMLRVAIPYGMLHARQLRMLAHIARKYDKGYARFTARQNIQFHWPALADIPAILADLATVGMYAIQTDGKGARDVTADHPDRADGEEMVRLDRLDSRSFGEWLGQSVTPHSHPDYATVTISLEGTGEAPGDISDSQMEAVADLAERYGFDEVRVTHEQNMVLPHVARADLEAIYDGLVENGLVTANAGPAVDIAAYPGLDHCAAAGSAPFKEVRYGAEAKVA